VKIDDFSLRQVMTSNMLCELQENGNVKVTVIACDVGIVPQMIQAGLSTAVELAVVSARRMIAARFGRE